VITTTLQQKRNLGWKKIGSEVKRFVTAGAPFTFGRALGLGLHHPDEGSQLFIDGVAVFNRVLTIEELKELSFE